MRSFHTRSLEPPLFISSFCGREDSIQFRLTKRRIYPPQMNVPSTTLRVHAICPASTIPSHLTPRFSRHETKTSSSNIKESSRKLNKRQKETGGKKKEKNTNALRLNRPQSDMPDAMPTEKGKNDRPVNAAPPRPPLPFLFYTPTLPQKTPQTPS